MNDLLVGLVNANLQGKPFEKGIKVKIYIVKNRKVNYNNHYFIDKNAIVFEEEIEERIEITCDHHF